MSDKNVFALRLLFVALIAAVALSASACISEYENVTNRAEAFKARTASLAAGTPSVASTTSAAAATAPFAYTPPAPDPKTATNPDSTPIAEALPYENMPASLIDDTWLGAHDGTEGAIGGTSKWAGATPYYWLAHNGTGDKVFEAYVRDGKVVRVIKDNVELDYWSEAGKLLSRNLPDLDAAGKRVERTRLPAKLPDPADYDDPDSYAMDAEGYFREHGSEHPERDAEAYWWKNR